MEAILNHIARCNIYNIDHIIAIFLLCQSEAWIWPCSQSELNVSLFVSPSIFGQLEVCKFSHFRPNSATTFFFLQSHWSYLFKTPISSWMFRIPLTLTSITCKFNNIISSECSIPVPKKIRYHLAEKPKKQLLLSKIESTSPKKITFFSSSFAELCSQLFILKNCSLLF